MKCNGLLKRIFPESWAARLPADQLKILEFRINFTQLPTNAETFLNFLFAAPCRLKIRGPNVADRLVPRSIGVCNFVLFSHYTEATTKMGCSQRLRNPVPKDTDEGVETISSVPSDQNVKWDHRIHTFITTSKLYYFRIKMTGLF